MKIGVTGIFASGKGTVCGFFEELGASVIDTDIIAREIVEPGSPVLKELVKAFGSAILTRTGSLDRQGLASITFGNSEKVRRLNTIMHPAILEHIFELVKKAPSKIHMINTPLLFESGFNTYMDHTIVVCASEDQVLQRGSKRDNIKSADIKNRLKHQISLKEKVKKADYVIDNSSTIDNTKRQVHEIWKILKEKIKTE